MNVYVREVARELARRGHTVDVFTRNQNPDVPTISHALGPRARVIHVTAGPPHPIPKDAIADHLEQFVAEVLVYSNGQPYDIIYAHYWLSGLAAMHLRAYWAGAGRFGVLRNRRWRAQLDWDTALAAVASFRGLPDVEEVVEFLDSAYAEWCAGVERGWYRCDFVDFFESVACSPMTACAVEPAVIAGAGCDLLEQEEDAGWWPGYGSPATRLLADYGLITR